MKDNKTDSKANDKDLDPILGIIIVGGLGFLIGREIINRLSPNHKEDEKPSRQYSTELEALRRLFREGLL